MRIDLTGALALVCAIFASSWALADCKPLSLVTSVDFVPGEQNRQIHIPVTVNGKDRLMIVDTGADISSIWDESIDELGLQRSHGNLVMTDVSGRESSEYVRTPISIGRISGKDFVLMDWRGGALSDDPKVVGLLGHDVLQRYDVDVDFTNNKINLMNPDHCEGKVIYWPAEAVAVVPIIVLHNGNIQLTVTLDGQPVVAMLDTGSTDTTLSLPVAEGQYGLKLGSVDSPATGSLPGRPGSLTYEHTFKSLAFEGIAVGNPRIEIIPDLFHARNVAESHANGWRLVDPRDNTARQSMLLGMNIMRHFHFYIAYKENKIYITPATPLAANAAQSAPAAATQPH